MSFKEIVVSKDRPVISLKTVFLLWWPLALSFELMMLEGPTFQGAIGRLPNAALNIAAFGLTMALAMTIESPVIMLLPTAIALVKDANSYWALRRFMLTLCAMCTLLTGLVAFTPLFEFITCGLMRLPADIAAAARSALQVMLFWIACIGWRRFYQGILVRHGYTRMVSYGTAIRLLTAIGTSAGLVRWGQLPGAQVAGFAIMASVFAEAMAITLFALPVVRREVLSVSAPKDSTLSQWDIFRFHAPLAATTLLTLLTQPMTSAALASLDAKESTLAAWPVAFMLILVIRGGCLAVQEITIAQARHAEALPVLQRFAWMVGLLTTLLAGLVAFTPLLDLYLYGILNLPATLYSFVHTGVLAGLFMPLLTALGAWARGLLVVGGATKEVYRGMGVSLVTQGVLLAIGVVLRLPGMWVAASAQTIAAGVEYLYLIRRVHHPKGEQGLEAD